MVESDIIEAASFVAEFPDVLAQADQTSYLYVLPGAGHHSQDASDFSKWCRTQSAVSVRVLQPDAPVISLKHAHLLLPVLLCDPEMSRLAVSLMIEYLKDRFGESHHNKNVEYTLLEYKRGDMHIRRIKYRGPASGLTEVSAAPVHENKDDNAQ